MEELLRTNDAVLLTYIEALLGESGLDYMIADRNMSIVEGSIGALPRRVLVAEEDAARARTLLRAAGVL